METPSSATRRITRSQAYAAANNSDNVSALKEESLKSRQTMRQQDRSALVDITNDSPIAGLAMGKLGTPSNLMSKKGFISTPGSGEALLRGQVKTLLQKVEEEAEISKLSSVPRRPLLHLKDQFFISPMCHLAAPTPANTPQIISNPSAILSDNSIGLASILESVVIPQGELEKDLMVTRSLMLDFSEKSEGSSIWSIQVNANSKDNCETDEEEIEEEEEEIDNDDDRDFEETDEEETGGDAGLVDELCQAISKINVNAKFCGKHTKFVYNSDDEFEGEEVFSSEIDESPSALKLQGWPSPKGKHFRFPEALDD